MFSKSESLKIIFFYKKVGTNKRNKKLFNEFLDLFQKVQYLKQSLYGNRIDLNSYTRRYIQLRL